MDHRICEDDESTTSPNSPVWDGSGNRRPPYGYLIVDAGPHPNPAKAADGKRLHKLDLDPDAAPVVLRIFAEFIAGHGFYAIAEGLTRDGIPCPSAHDPARNRHRCGIAWNKFAVRAILVNPRYTGHHSLDELTTALEKWIKLWRENARPFKWTQDTRSDHRPHLPLLLTHPRTGTLVVLGRNSAGDSARPSTGAVTHAVLHHADGPVAVIPE